MGTLRYIQAVLWGFVGLGRRDDMAELHRAANPVLLIAIGIAMAVLFVLILIGLAMLAVRAAT